MNISRTAQSFAAPQSSPRITASPAAASPKSSATASKELTPDEEAVVRELSSRDREVKAHEAAHSAAGGACVRGGPTFSYQTGPDGKKYAVGGEVSIDTSAVKGDPAATITKMQQVIAAANAPANPSGQDRAVAAAAAQASAAAQAELAEQRAAEQQGKKPTGSSEVKSADAVGYSRRATSVASPQLPSINFSA